MENGQRVTGKVRKKSALKNVNQIMAYSYLKYQ